MDMNMDMNMDMHMDVHTHMHAAGESAASASASAASSAAAAVGREPGRSGVGGRMRQLASLERPRARRPWPAGGEGGGDRGGEGGGDLVKPSLVEPRIAARHHLVLGALERDAEACCAQRARPNIDHRDMLALAFHALRRGEGGGCWRHETAAPRREHNVGGTKQTDCRAYHAHRVQ